MLNKLLGKKKEQNYFLEFDIKESKTPSTKTEVKNTENSEAKSTPKRSSTVNYDQPEWVKAIKNYSNQNANEASEQNTGNGNFAGKYVSNNVPMSRRRPGASLNTFKKIASKMDV